MSTDTDNRYSDELPVDDVTPYDSPLSADPREKRDEAVNFALLTMHQVFLRVGWIFKTESIVMPVFMDFIGGGPVLRGVLMVLSRIGLSVPPVLFSRQLKIARQKKWWLSLCGLAMSIPFGLLAWICWQGTWRDTHGDPRWWMPVVFLILYGIFFMLTGMNQLTAHAIQGKLIRVNRRGRLFTASVAIGAPLAILGAWNWMPIWLEEPDTGFAWLFGCAAVAFFGTGLVTMLLREEPDDFQQDRSPVLHYFRDAWRVVARDPNARSLALLTVLMSFMFMLFPHYVAVIDDRPTFDLKRMTSWVCLQNAGTALLSLIVGPLADRFGNRAALHLTTLGLAVAPALGLVGLYLPSEVRLQYAWLMFTAVGFTPVTLRLMINYALEIAPRDDHPKYISTLGLCVAIPVVIGAPLVGWIAREWGYQPIFLLGLVMLLAALVQTFRIAEPRTGESSLLHKALRK
ncbi:MFS transporter [Aeoliella mucimassa]|uniref:Major Facilitator Superfamily protein n=1 Tax=Aeoliella mucimassa TaxID=2527972 RepID=A0A518AJ11_9BACT|nr:MFS transporter [Aeoliella mucimassa]QDU54696.1 Major Facilitator Superfamily protein [Aeoliella mucimassa]